MVDDKDEDDVAMFMMERDTLAQAGAVVSQSASYALGRRRRREGARRTMACSTMPIRPRD
jgi:hypothetical protein